MSAPVRAFVVVIPALNGSVTVRVHVINVDIPFGISERFWTVADRESRTMAQWTPGDYNFCWRCLGSGRCARSLKCTT
jgi:hypothetical protein